MSDVDIMEYDLILVGASPSSLTCALRLVDLAKESGQELSIAVMEKAREIGYFSLSGALSNPRVLNKLFPNWQTEEGFPHEGVITESFVTVLGVKNSMDLLRLAVPPGLKKEGYVALTLSNLVKYMADELEKRAEACDNVEVEMFPGFPVIAPVYNEADDGIRGVQVGDTGDPESDFIHAKMVIFGEKGFVSRDIYKKFNLCKNPQVYSVGVKEVWKITKDLCGKAWHTMGWPVMDGTLGGGFVYGLKDNMLAVGMVVSLDSHNPNIYPQQVLQDFKKHPWVQDMIKGGEMIKYGASNLPEGGYYSLPEKFALAGCMFLGDSLGTLDVQSLSGVDKAMESGWIAAEIAHVAFQKEDFTEAGLSGYKTALMDSFVGKELYAGRNFRFAFEKYPDILTNIVPDLCINTIDKKAKVGLLNLAFFGLGYIGKIGMGLGFNSLQSGGGPEWMDLKKDWEHISLDYKKPEFGMPEGFDKSTLITVADAVYTSETKYEEGQDHIDEFSAEACVACVAEYHALNFAVPCVADCTAEVHRMDDIDGVQVHKMSFENCVQCRTCEIVCPKENLRVNAAGEGSGPNFMGL